MRSGLYQPRIVGVNTVLLQIIGALPFCYFNDHFAGGPLAAIGAKTTKSYCCYK